MECEHKNLTQSQFDKKTKAFSTRKKLYFFLMNVLNLITYNGHYYCFCDKERKKHPTKRTAHFVKFLWSFVTSKRTWEKNMFNEKFLWDYHNKFIFHLQQIFEMDKSALCCFLDNEFHYRGRDWYTGKTWNVSYVNRSSTKKN